jgi:Dolichyl-phosphate-mannose-protein mannosyltransferase
MDRTSERSQACKLVSGLNQPSCYWPLAFLLAGFYVATSLYISAHRLLWYDEIFTAITSRLPDLRTMWKSLGSAEIIPPLYFLITRIFDQLFRHADIGIRVPSALAVGAGMLVTFDLTRRLTDGLCGLIAMSFLTTSFVTYYAYEARPYAICFMLAAIALWLWVVTKHESKTAAAGFGALFFIGVAIHYYFVLCLVPFGILALAERRIFHPKVIAAAAGVMCSLAVLYPQIVSSLQAMRGAVIPSWALPSGGKLEAVYLEFFPTAIIPLVLVTVGVAVFGRSRERVVPSMSAGERVGWLFLTVPLAAYLLAHLVTHYFHSRYIIGAVPGIVLAVTCLFWRHCRECRHLLLALLLVFGGYGISQQLRTLRSINHIQAFGDYQERTREMLALEDTLQREGKRHFAVASNLLFLEAWYYSKHPEQYAYVTSQPWNTRKYAALSFVSVEEIVANAGQTAVIAPDPALAEALDRAGLHLKVRFAYPYVLYLE